MSKYELLFILPGTLDENEAGTRSQEVVNLVKEFGNDADLQPMGKNRLAYPVKQIRYGYYFTIIFDSTPEKVKELQAKLSLTRDLLRAMVTHFNTSLTAAQKVAYTTNAAGVTVMGERTAPVSAAVVPEVGMEALVAATVAETVSAPEFKVEAKPEEVKPEEKPVVHKSDKASLDEINKKLDDIISGDIIAGV